MASELAWNLPLARAARRAAYLGPAELYCLVYRPRGATSKSLRAPTR
jgi:hypothetical protein